MTEQVVAPEANQEVQTPPVEKQAEQTPARDFDAEAREMGWVPETEFKGPADKWKPAQQFVEDGERILPIVRSQNKKLQEKLEKQEAEFAKRTERLERMTAKTVERMQAQHKAELEAIQTAKLKAVEEGDTAEYKKLDKQEKALADVKFDDVETKPTDAQATKEATIAKWQEANAWYGSDEDLTVYAQGYSVKVAHDNPRMSMVDNLKRVDAKLREVFPEKFGGKKPAAWPFAAVDGGGEFPGASKKEGPGSKLPSEARAMAERDVKAGLYKSVDDWAKVYNSK